MRGSGVAWRRLHLPAPMEAETARAVLVAVATMSGQPRVVFEAVGQAGKVAWFVGAEPDGIARLTALVTTHVPGIRIETVEAVTGEPHDLDGAEAVSTGQVRLSGSERLPLRDGERPHVTRSLLAAVSAASRAERVVVQLVLGPRERPVFRPTTGQHPREEAARASEYGFGCALRIAASAKDDGRARALTRGVVAALGGLAAPGVRLKASGVSARAVQTVTSPLLWPLWLRVSDLVAVLGWPTAPLPLPGVPSAHPRLLPPVAKAHGRVIGASTTHPERDVALSVEASLRHLHLLGPTGAGKSTVMAHLALADITAGRGLVVIDPKGDLVRDIACRVPAEHLERVVLLDPTDHEPVGINALAGEPDLAADTLLGVMHALYAEAWGPRTHDLLHASLLSLARWGHGSLPMVSTLLTVPGFRRRVVGTVAEDDRLGLGAFWAGFEAMSEGERSHATAPLLNKLRPITMRPGLRAMFGQTTPRFNLSQVFTEDKVLLVSLAKGTLGPEASQLLGALLVGLVWQHTLQRANVPARARRPVMVMVDEVQDYLKLPGDLGDILAQARGLGVGLTLAHQHLDQLPTALKAGVLANARSRVSFTLSPKDAPVIAGTSGGLLDAEDFRALPAFHAYVQLLVAGAVAPPVSITTKPLGAGIRSFETAQALSRERYGRVRAEVDADLLAALDASGSATPTRTGSGRQASKDGEGLGRVRRTPTKPTTPAEGQDGGAA